MTGNKKSQKCQKTPKLLKSTIKIKLKKCNSVVTNNKYDIYDRKQNC